MTSNLVQSLKNSLENFSERIFLTFKKDFIYDRYSYAKIYDFSLRFTAFLKEYNIKKGDKIAICSYNSPQ